MNKSTLRLVYPQWQGAIYDKMMPDRPPDAPRSYYLGSQILNMLAPTNTNQKTVQVPVSIDLDDRAIENGVHSYKVIVKQTNSAMQLVNENQPDRIITLGGECSVSVVPFTYLSSKYPNDIAIIWIDAHPDVALPYDDYNGYHAMALTAIMGLGDEAILKMLPSKVPASRTLLVGLREWDKGMKERQIQLGVEWLSPKQVSMGNTKRVMDWLRNTGVSKVAIHMDFDVMDPSDLVAGCAIVPNGIMLNDFVQIVNDIASLYDIVGLTIAEPVPRMELKIKDMMDRLPIFKD